MSRKIMIAVGIAAIFWSAGGVYAYLDHVGMFGAAGLQMPTFITAAFATSAFGSLIGGIGLAALRSWAEPVLWLAFAAAIVNWTWVFLYGRAGEVPLGVTVLTVSLVIAFAARHANRARLTPR